MHRTPNASDILIDTNHVLAPDQFILLAGVGDEELDLLQDLLLLEVAQTHGLLATVDVVGLDDGVFIGSRGDAELGARVLAREGREQGRRQERFHPARRAGPVAVVEVETFAL